MSNQTPKSPSEIANEISSDYSKLVRESGGSSFIAELKYWVTEALTLERLEADKLRGEVKILKHDLDHMEVKFENDTETIEELHQQLSNAKGDCHCGESHRLKLQLAELRQQLDTAHKVFAADCDGLGNTIKELSEQLAEKESELSLAVEGLEYFSSHGLAEESRKLVDELLTKLRGEK